MKSGEGRYWPDPEPPLLLVLDPASDAPVAAVLAEPAASHMLISWTGFCLFAHSLACSFVYSLNN